MYRPSSLELQQQRHTALRRRQRQTDRQIYTARHRTTCTNVDDDYEATTRMAEKDCSAVGTGTVQSVFYSHTKPAFSECGLPRGNLSHQKNKSKCHMLLLLPIDTSRWSCHRWPPPPAPAPPVYANCQLLEPD